MKVKKSIIIGFIAIFLIINAAVLYYIIDRLVVRDYGGFKITFELRDSSNSDIIINTTGPISIIVTYNKEHKDQTDKHYELIYNFPFEWRTGDYVIRINYMNVTLKEHYSIEKIDDFEIGHHPVWEGWSQPNIGNIYNLSIWELGNGPYPEISYF